MKRFFSTPQLSFQRSHERSVTTLPVAVTSDLGTRLFAAPSHQSHKAALFLATAPAIVNVSSPPQTALLSPSQLNLQIRSNLQPIKTNGGETEAGTTATIQDVTRAAPFLFNH